MPAREAPGGEYRDSEAPSASMPPRVPSVAENRKLCCFLWKAASMSATTRTGSAPKRRSRRTKCTLDVCDDCPALCCHDLVMPIEKPKTEEDVSELKWELQYDTIRVFIRSHRWYRIIKGRCMYLDESNLCRIYATRPKRCREHNPPQCERFGDFYEAMISTPQELEAYLARRKRR